MLDLLLFGIVYLSLTTVCDGHMIIVKDGHDHEVMPRVASGFGKDHPANFHRERAHRFSSL